MDILQNSFGQETAIDSSLNQLSQSSKDVLGDSLVTTNSTASPNYGITDDILVGTSQKSTGTESSNASTDPISNDLAEVSLIGSDEDQRYCLLKVEKRLQATLEGPIKREIEDQIFQQWLAEKLQQVTIRISEFAANLPADEQTE